MRRTPSDVERDIAILIAVDVATGRAVWVRHDRESRLDALGVFEKDRWRRSGVSDSGRAFARAMLLSPVP